ncbi:hypothetical protein FIBSPDRAFT_220700 [Athelia psychrophila]|uniref:Uncharacterized protein n=1 Tax=Athelia psychrophila TaxID=1759441 RepID=A0A165Z4W0_9AGAM|nr:hypothetical protein FIBSPDRAFT_220700 [Fibularhizoctonia sp. CBS 109695]
MALKREGLSIGVVEGNVYDPPFVNRVGVSPADADRQNNSEEVVKEMGRFETSSGWGILEAGWVNWIVDLDTQMYVATYIAEASCSTINVEHGGCSRCPRPAFFDPFRSLRCCISHLWRAATISLHADLPPRQLPVCHRQNPLQSKSEPNAHEYMFAGILMPRSKVRPSWIDAMRAKRTRWRFCLLVQIISARCEVV